MMVGIRKRMLAAAVAVFTLVGIAASIIGGAYLKSVARDEWMNAAKAEAAQITDTILLWISQAESHLRAVALLHVSSGHATFVDELAAVEAAAFPNHELTFETVALVKAIGSAERVAFEEAAGGSLTAFGRRGDEAPQAYAHYVVIDAFPESGFLTRLADLAALAATSETVSTAISVPGSAFTSPSYTGASGDKYALMALQLNEQQDDTVIAGAMNVSEFLSGNAVFTMPRGMSLRLAERETERQETSRVVAVVGGLEAPANTVFTNTIRITTGLAKWNLSWDFSDGYLGGPAVGVGAGAQWLGSLLSLIFGAFLGHLMLENARVNRLVENRTAELKKKSDLLQLTMDSIDQAFVVWDSNFRLAAWNRLCHKYWPKPDEFLKSGTPLIELLEHLAEIGALGPGDPAKLALEKFETIKHGDPDDEFVLPEGGIIFVQRYPMAGGGYVSTYTDVTDRRRTELDLRTARERAETANRAKSEFLSSMSHELRTPLHAILGFSQLLESDTVDPLTGNQKRSIGRIIEAAQHLLELITELLDFSQIDSGRIKMSIEECDPGAIVEECIQMVKGAAKDHGVHLHSPKRDRAVPLVKADRTRLRQILLNLLTNAVKYNYRGGIVWIEIDEPDERSLKITVSDTGPGIASDKHGKVFELFNRVGAEDSAVEGAGIGLAVAKNLIEMMGGAIGFHSEPGRGTSFWIKLGISGEATAAPPESVTALSANAEPSPAEETPGASINSREQSQ